MFVLVRVLHRTLTHSLFLSPSLPPPHLCHADPGGGYGGSGGSGGGGYSGGGGGGYGRYDGGPPGGVGPGYGPGPWSGYDGGGRGGDWGARDSRPPDDRGGYGGGYGGGPPPRGGSDDRSFGGGCGGGPPKREGDWNCNAPCDTPATLARAIVVCLRLLARMCDRVACARHRRACVHVLMSALCAQPQRA